MTSMGIVSWTRIRLMAMKALESYRRLLLAFFGYSSKSVMPKGYACHVEDPTMEITHGDVVHPCVKYIEKGFEGHKWWMVYTPYYAENNKIENPRLCYSDAFDGELPTEWKFYCEISHKLEEGYNSDPVMLYDEGELYIFWREYKSPRAKKYGCCMITIGCTVHNRQVIWIEEPQLMEKSSSDDKELSPSVVKYNNSYKAYSIHMHFNPDYIFWFPQYIGSRLFKFKIVYLLDVLGICDMNKSYGIAIWDSESLRKTFRYIKTVQFENKSRFYQPWHMEVFKECDNNDKPLYAVVQSRQRHGRICLAKSEDGEIFRLYRKPLMTSKTAGMLGLYKPSAVHKGSKLFLFYTVIDNDDNKLHQLFVTTANWDNLKEGN